MEDTCRSLSLSLSLSLYLPPFFLTLYSHCWTINFLHRINLSQFVVSLWFHRLLMLNNLYLLPLSKLFIHLFKKRHAFSKMKAWNTGVIYSFFDGYYRAKKYPIKVESKTLEIYNGHKIFYIYLETSWEKESWCKALRFASCDDKDRMSWYYKLSEDFSSYLTSLNSGYASFMKTSVGFCAEPIDRESRHDGSSSKVRHFLKKLTKKASRINVENKASWALSLAREERKISERSRSLQHSLSATCSSQGVRTGKTLNSLVEENVVPSSSSTMTPSASQTHMSINSETDSEDKLCIDEGMLCWNLLISRLFFDARRSEEIKNSLQARIQVLNIIYFHCDIYF